MDGFMMFKKALQKHFDEMQKEATHLFEVNVDRMNYGIHILIASLLVQMRFSESVESMIVVVVGSLLRILVLLSLSRIIRFIQFGN